METIVSGIKTKYLKKGCGPNLVLIPGWKTDIERMALPIEVISKHFTVYTLDLPGTGGTSDIKKFTIREYSSFVSEWIRKLRIKKFILGGISMGGQILVFTLQDQYVQENAIGILLIYPLYNVFSIKLKKLTLKSMKVGSSILWRKPFCTIADKMTHSKRFMKLIIRVFEKERELKKGKNLEYHAEHFSRFKLRVSMQTINDSLKVNFDNCHYRFDTPAVLIMSKNDPMISYENVFIGYKKIFPNLREVIMPGKVHAERKKVTLEEFSKNYEPAIKKTKRMFERWVRR